MEKILLTLACMFGMSTATFAYTHSAVMLEHDGVITTYDAENIGDAVEAADDGDVIYLTEGTFSSFDVTKRISIKGAGQLTKIVGDINIEIPNEPVLSDPVFEYVNINGYIKVISASRGFKIKQCLVSSVVFFADTYDAYIDRCSITAGTASGYNGLNVSYYKEKSVTINGYTSKEYIPYVKSLTVTNSKIYSVYGDSSVPNNTTFVNCHITHIRGCAGNVINSIVNHTDERYPDYLDNSIFINSCIGDGTNVDNATNRLTNCYRITESLQENVEDLTSLGYLGSDGTVVGTLGGNTPFTLVPTVPHVTEANLSVDPQKQELNVSVTVTPK